MSSIQVMQLEYLLICGYINRIRRKSPTDVVKKCFEFFFVFHEQSSVYINCRFTDEDVKRSFMLKYNIFGVSAKHSFGDGGLKYLFLTWKKIASNVRKITVAYQIKITDGDNVSCNEDIIAFYKEDVHDAFKPILDGNKKSTKTKSKCRMKKMIKLDHTRETQVKNMQLYVRIMRIEYDNGFADEFKSNPKLFAKIHCEWNISEISETSNKVIVSDKFNDDCWCLAHDGKEYFLRLLFLPNAISRITVKLSYNVTKNKRKSRRKQKLHSFVQHTIQTFTYKHNLFKWESLDKSLSLTMNIVKLYDMDLDENVEEEYWSDYGVSNNPNMQHITLASVGTS